MTSNIEKRLKNLKLPSEEVSMHKEILEMALIKKYIPEVKEKNNPVRGGENFMKILMGRGVTLAIAAILLVGGTGVYALTNWFGGTPTVENDGTILSVDVSSCKDDIYPYIVPNHTPSKDLGTEQTDFKNLKFKVIGNPHISADDLQKQLLIDCEAAAVRSYFATNNVGDMTEPGTISALNGAELTVDYMFNGENRQKTFALDGVTVIEKGKATTKEALSVGSYAYIAYPHPSTNKLMSDAEVRSIDFLRDASKINAVFITTYNMQKTSGDPNGEGINYSRMNIMPLDAYERLKNNK